MPPDMPGPSGGGDESFPGRTPSPARIPQPGSGLRSAVITAILATIVFGVATYELIRGDLSTIWAELSAGVALVAFGVAVYGILRTILALIESAGERRRQTREFTERRMGDRASKPPGS